MLFPAEIFNLLNFVQIIVFVVFIMFCISAQIDIYRMSWMLPHQQQIALTWYIICLHLLS